MIYKIADDIYLRSKEIIEKLGFNHIDISRVGFIRSYGSKSKRTIARCHAISRIFDVSFQIKPRYVIEVISERFDKLNEKEQKKVLIHELMHIPKSFGGGFRHHDYVSEKNVNFLYNKLNKSF